MGDRWSAAWESLPEYLSAHVALSAAAMGLGLLIAAPLTLAARRNQGVRRLALGAAGVVQTVPSLALLALFFPLLLALSQAAEAMFGRGFSALGFLPSLMALTLYALLPILRNGVAGLTGVPSGLTEAARSLGLGRWTSLWLVEIPVAAPVLMAGVRTAAVLVIGTATLATPVGQASLGNYIFTGLQTEDWVAVLFGCAFAAGLALVVDALLGLVEAGVARGDRRGVAGGLSGLLLGAGAALAPLAADGGADRYVVGAKNFSEQFILAEVIERRLRAAGAETTRRDGLGSAVVYRALAGGEIDVYVDYSGTLWANALGRTDAPPRTALLAELTRELRRRDGVTVLGSLGFENAYALAMKRERAEALGVRSLADLARVAPRLTLGADLEFLARPEWAAIRNAYGLRFGRERSYQPTFMYRALAGGDADVISAFSSDGRIAADDLVILTDPKGAVLSYDAVLLLAPGRGEDARLLKALGPLVGAVALEPMQRANYAVDGQGAAPVAAAAALEAALSPPRP
ncbi:MAG: ABC transporter permease/substrate-binding protein [Pseudomonadota bacterium]|nr:ABC transporter permease/substrate-binding protein [Pseudomonadota bacterium]